MCIKLNLQNPVVSHWSDCVCNSVTETLAWKVQPWRQFLLLWRVRNYAPASLALMSCINNVLCQWRLATDCFEMDNHNFHLHSLELLPVRDLTVFYKIMHKWPNPFAPNPAVGEADHLQIASNCKTNSFRAAHWHFITRAKFFLAVGASHVQEWTNHPERHNLCPTECDSSRHLAKGPTFSLHWLSKKHQWFKWR